MILISRLVVLSLIVMLTAAAAPAGPQLKPAVLGKADADASRLVETEGETFRITATGRESFGHSDSGTSFVYLPTDAPNFTFIARIAEAPTGTPNPKYGIALRAGTDHNDRMITARYDGYEGNEAIQWFFRHGVAGNTHDGAKRIHHSGVEKQMKAKQGFWLKLERRYPTVRLFWSADGNNWQPIAEDYHLALLEQEVLVGLHVTGGGNGNTPVTAVFDNVSFTDDGGEAVLSRDSYREHRPAMKTWQMHLTQLPTKRGPQSFFILKPKDMPWADVRALYYTTGSKEVVLQQRGQLQFENAEAKKRRPVGMSEWEGVYEIDNLRQFYQILGHHKIARLGGAGHYRYLPQAMERLAEQIGEPTIANMPLVATGESAAGGATASVANQFPERVIATGVNLIGMAGWDTDNQTAIKTPRLYVFGSQDTGGQHIKQAREVDRAVRERGALWAEAPTWWGYHVWWRSDQIILPYLLRNIDLRLPAKPDYSKPVPLKSLRERDGWIGLNDTWTDNYPTIIPWAKASEDQRRGDSSWLPDEYTARLWQAYVSNWPRTVIHFPRHDGTGGWARPAPPKREHHFMPADQPWNLLASGPMGEDVKVTWYAGLKPLKVLKTYNGNPYTVQLEPLPAGLHMIHAIVRIGDEQEISHAHPILFQVKK